MVRKARKRSLGAATARNIARREQEEFAKQLRREIASGLQGAAIEIMNSLAEKGPAWSGRFSASWRFVPEGADPGGPGPDGQIYRYSKKDVRIDLIERYMRGGKTGASTIIADQTQFQIVNTTTYANIAIDVDEGVLRRDYAETAEPLKEPTLGDGRDNPSYRYDIGANFSGSLEEAPAARTAEPFWYQTYYEGGPLQRDLGRGFSIGLKASF
jgi:hypothetical protein